jgi:hypothetical protein
MGKVPANEQGTTDTYQLNSSPNTFKIDFHSPRKCSDDEERINYERMLFKIAPDGLKGDPAEAHSKPEAIGRNEGVHNVLGLRQRP